MTDLISAHAAHLRAAGRARNTVNDRVDLLRRMDHDLPMGLEQATVEELAEWLAHDGWSASTRATYHAHVSEFFRWACNPANPMLDYNPAASLTRPRVPQRLPKPVTDAELAHALKHARAPWRLLVLLAAYEGLRCCELATIRREHVTQDELVVVGKGGKERMIGTHPIVWRAVRDLPAGRLARGLSARRISSGGIEEMARIGLPRVSMHRYRHWCFTTVLRRTGNLRTVQELAGHASPSTTAGYTLITNEQRRMAIRALPVLAPLS